jgi:hypothetical protein
MFIFIVRLNVTKYWTYLEPINRNTDDECNKAEDDDDDDTKINNNYMKKN